MTSRRPSKMFMRLARRCAFGLVAIAGLIGLPAAASAGFTFGACCLPTGCCMQVASAEECTGLEGTFQGTLTLCDFVTCGDCPETNQACCFPDGSCQDLNGFAASINCFIANGTLRPQGTSCADTDCDEGACCINGVTCITATPIGCEKTPGGVYLGDGLVCDDLVDCDDNGVFDVCELDANDCNGNQILDACETAPEPAADPMPDNKKECIEKEFFVADDCAFAEHVCPGAVYTGSTVGATNDGGLSSCDGGIPYYDVWYRYRPAWSGPAIFSYLGSPLPMAVEIYDGCPDFGGVRVGCSTTPDNEAKVIVDSKHDYWIRLGLAGDMTGPYVFEITGPECALNAIDCNANGIPDECECLADVDGNGIVDVFDFVQVLVANGVVCNGCPEDVDGNGVVDTNDVTIVLSNQGRCPFGHLGDGTGDGTGDASHRGGGGLAPNAFSR